MARSDWEALRPLLHPYVWLRFPDGSSLQVRKQVVERLQSRGGELELPASVELRDGQIYRWVS